MFLGFEMVKIGFWGSSSCFFFLKKRGGVVMWLVPMD